MHRRRCIPNQSWDKTGRFTSTRSDHKPYSFSLGKEKKGKDFLLYGRCRECDNWEEQNVLNYESAIVANAQATGTAIPRKIVKRDVVNDDVVPEFEVVDPAEVVFEVEPLVFELEFDAVLPFELYRDV